MTTTAPTPPGPTLALDAVAVAAQITATTEALTLGRVDQALADAGYRTDELPRRIVRDLAGLNGVFR